MARRAVGTVDKSWSSLALVRELLAAGDPPAGPDTAAGTRVKDWLRRVCDTAVQAIPADGATVSLVADGTGLAVAAASDPVADSLGTVQFTLGEGPCVDAFAAGHPVMVPELGRVPATRWPGFTPAAQALGVSSVFAFPLRVGAAQLGALSLHRLVPGALDARGTALSLAFADITVDELLSAQAGGPDPAADGDGRSDDVLGEHYVVYQAQGMTMVDLGVPLLDALARLRAHAFAEGRALHEVAQDVVDGRLRLDPDPPGRAP